MAFTFKATSVRGATFLVGLTALLSSMGCQSTQSSATGSCIDDLVNGCRPFRGGIIKLDRPLDNEKELAPLDDSGWAVQSGHIIGQVRRDWVGSFTTSDFHNVWWHKITSPLSTRPHIYGNYIFLAQRNGAVQKLEFASGKALWTSSLTKFVNAPMTTAANAIIATTADQKIFSLEQSTGKVGWVRDIPSSDTLLNEALPAPAIHGETVYVGTTDGQLITYNLKTGNKIWQYNPEYSSSKFRSVVGQLVFFGGDVLVARNDGIIAAVPYADTPQNNTWLRRIPGATTTSFRDGVYYVGCINGDVYALDPASGKSLWKVSTTQPVAQIFIGETFIAVSGTNGRISGLALDGTLKWLDDVNGSLSQAPIPLKDTLYFPTGNKVLYGYKVLGQR